MDNTYHFHPEKKVMKQGFLLEDDNGNLVYEARVIKQPIIGPGIFEFVNHFANKSEEHKIGQTVTIETRKGEEYYFDNYSVKSYFKYDGENIWQYLHGLGIRIDSFMSEGKLGMTYNVTLNGDDFAVISTASLKGALSFLTSSSNLDIRTSPGNLDLAFLTAFSIARTEQINYD